MGKNLVFVAAGDTSLHNLWAKGDFDLYVNYYGEVIGRYSEDTQFYSTFKGTKFKILDQVLDSRPDLLECYDNIWVPDDDLFLPSEDVSKLFKTFDEFGLCLAQPGLIGYISIPITAAVPFSRLRYTNWVEIMCPVFSAKSLGEVRWTFRENDSHWGIEFLWNHILGGSKDKIGIIDEVVAVHTRPCFHGDNYFRNDLSYESAVNDCNGVMNKYQLPYSHVVYETVPVTFQDFIDLPSQSKFVPNIPKLKDAIKLMRSSRSFI